jgi:hypothetical protein
MKIMVKGGVLKVRPVQNPTQEVRIKSNSIQDDSDWKKIGPKEVRIHLHTDLPALTERGNRIRPLWSSAPQESSPNPQQNLSNF